jgi:predicted Ser/Thr protein kinase
VRGHAETYDVKLGRYEVVRELGKGAMGIVYLAKDPLIGRLVALKTIRPAAHADDDEIKEFQQRFMREAQAAGILNHPSIVTVFDIGQDEPTGMSFIAMEYVEGQNLKEAIAQNRAFTFEEVAEIMAQVADALDFAHAKGIVHRDVKPANIILIDGGRAKITDFGIAKIASSGNLTTTGQFLGTPNYMAPEQIKGSPVDGRTDLFSLGIVLYETLTKRKPFGGDSLTTISYRIVHESFQTPRDINPAIPDGYDEVVAKCLAKDPARRYQRGKELAKDLRAILHGGSIGRSVPHPPPDETVVTVDADKIPTLAMPFENAGGPGPKGVAVAETSFARQTPRRRTEPAAARSGGAVRGQLRRTLSDVPGGSVLMTDVSPSLFFGIVLGALILLGAGMLLIRSQTPPNRQVDLHAERLATRQHQLRMEANAFLKAGNTEGAYDRFQELSRIAPTSPYVTHMLQELGKTRLQKLSEQERKTESKSKFTQGVALFTSRRFSDATPLFQTAFELDPSSQDAANWLRMSRQEELRAETGSASAPNLPTGVPASPGSVAQPGAIPTSTNPAKGSSYASLRILFDSPLGDGYLMVSCGSQVVFHENIWEEKGRMVFRHKAGRTIDVSRQVVPFKGDLVVWVIYDSTSKLGDRAVIPVSFKAGTAHRLTVTFDMSSKKVGAQVT